MYTYIVQQNFVCLNSPLNCTMTMFVHHCHSLLFEPLVYVYEGQECHGEVVGVLKMEWACLYVDYE